MIDTNKLSEAFNKVLDEVSSLSKALLDRENKAVVREGVLSAKEEELNKKEVTLSEREATLVVQEASVEQKLQKVSSDEKVQQDKVDSENAYKSATLALKQAQEKLDSAKQAEKEVATRELNLAERESKYRETIKQEVIESLLRGGVGALPK